MGGEPKALSDRQQRERDFHRSFAARNAHIVDRPVANDILQADGRRWWNHYWSFYDRILTAQVAGKRVLVPGCGFGDDAVRLGSLGAEVHGFDISDEIIEITRARAARHGAGDIRLNVMVAEAMSYPDDYFDMILFVDILHHVDIAATMAETRRVLKPGGLIIGDELYTHSALQRIRDSALVAKHIYPRLEQWLYGRATPYITEDEHKVDQHEFAIVRAAMSDCDSDFFGLLEGRLFPNDMVLATKVDRVAMRVAGRLGSLLGGRVVFSGHVSK